MRPRSILLLAALLTLAFGLVGCGSEIEETPAEETPAATEEPAAEEETLAVELYFPGGGTRLYGETRELALREEVAEQAQLIVEALIAGPKSEGLVPPLPQGVSLGGVYKTQPDELTIDLLSAEGEPPPSTGSLREMLMVYSLINSLALNLEGIDRVSILWNDRQPTTFAGHLDTTHSLGANAELVARLP